MLGEGALDPTKLLQTLRGPRASFAPVRLIGITLISWVSGGVVGGCDSPTASSLPVALQNQAPFEKPLTTTPVPPLSTSGMSTPIPATGETPTARALSPLAESSGSSNLQICNPFTGITPGGPRVLGTLRYLAQSSVDKDPTAPNLGSLMNPDLKIVDFGSFWRSAQPQAATFYFSQLNIPEQNFSSGFNALDVLSRNAVPLTYPQSGSLILNYFGFTLFTDLRLPPGTPSGPYQLSLGSSDGARLYVNPSGDPTQTPITPDLDNDGVHPMQTQEGSSTLMLSAEVPTHLNVQWFQAAPSNLGLVLSYRPYLLEGGPAPWMVVPPQMYQLPDQAPLPAPNLCGDET